MKRCSKCEKEKEDVEFSFRDKAAGLRHGVCKACVRAKSNDWYRDNRDRHAATSAKASARWRPKAKADRQIVVNLYKHGPCKDCGRSYPPWVMQFDHLDGEAKIDAVSCMVHDLKPIEAILAEIAKCELVCANCHAERTHQRRNS